MTDLNKMFGLPSEGQVPETPKADYSNVGQTGYDSTASREWATRPDDERYISVPALNEHLLQRRANSTEIQIPTSGIQARVQDHRLVFEIPGYNDLVEPTNLAFGQLCSRIRAPSEYLRRLSNETAVKCLQEGFDRSAVADEEAIALITKEADGGVPKLRAMTSPSYGRIWDSELSDAIWNMTKDTMDWQVPIAFHTPGMKYNPIVALDVTKNATTLYSGDRDTFIFLVDQTRPIVAGKLPDGSDRLFFRGFMAWNSEVGTKRQGIKTFLYEMVCMNRMIHGQGAVEEMSQRHTKAAPEKFVRQIMPALKAFLDGGVTGIEKGLIAAQHAIVARNDEQRMTYLEEMLHLGSAMNKRVLAAILAEEDHEMETVFDAVQGLTAVARSFTNQDRRVEMETVASELMEDFVAA